MPKRRINAKTKRLTKKVTKKVKSKNTTQVAPVPRLRPFVVTNPRMGSGSSLDECLSNFIKLRANPWAVLTGPICSPAGEGGFGLYAPCYSRGVLAVGTANAGFIYVNPYCGLGDKLSVFITTATYAATGVSASAVGTTQLGMAGSFTSTAIDKMKVISLGIRIWNLNPALTTKGQIVGFRTLDSQLVSSMTETEINNNRFNVYSPIKPGGAYAQVHQTYGGDYDDKWVSASEVASFNHGNLGLYIQNANPGDTFGYEVIGHFEYRPSNSANTKSTRHDYRADRAASGLAAEFADKSDNSWDTIKRYGTKAAEFVMKEAVRTAADFVAKGGPQIPIGLPLP